MIRLEHVDKYYNRNAFNQIHVVNDVSLELPDSGMVAVFGKSGCGKTTLLNVIGGLDKFSGGAVTIDGNDVSHDTDTLRNLYIGYVFQNYNLNVNETVAENVADALKLCGMRDQAEIDARVESALKAVDMSRFAKRTPDTLSGGQQQRVAIARAIVKNPRVVLADEPTGNLDEANTVLIMDLLHRIARDHLVILVTHEENLVDHYCNMVVELEDGKIVSVRENERVNGYSAKDKNAVYLGEFEKTERKDDVVSVEYYGDKPKDPIKLKIVNANGKTYLRIDTEGVRCIDGTGELKLVEGVFEEKGDVSERSSDKTPELPPMKYADNAPIGRLFNFKSAVKSGFKAVYGKKKGRFLRALMVLFALIVTFTTARFATTLLEIREVDSSYNHNVFYVYAEDENTVKSLTEAADSGIDYVRLVGSDIAYYYGGDPLYFSFGAFETFRSLSVDSMYINADKLDSSLSARLDAVVGKNLPDRGEIVLTTAVVDRLINNLNLPYLSDYSDFIGRAVSENYQSSSRASVTYRIVGIVRSDEPSVYLSSVDLIVAHMTSYRFSVAPASILSDIIDLGVTSGNAVYLFYNSEASPQNPDSIKICGKTFDVTLRNVNGDEDLLNAVDERLTYYGYSRYSGYSDKYVFVVSDEDFVDLASSYGKTDEMAFANESDSNFRYQGPAGVYGAVYALVHSSDPALTDRFIQSNITKTETPYLYTPEYYYQEAISSRLIDIVSAFTSLVILLVILSVCMYIIMRSALMSRIKEIGIYRAIGVKKGNIVFRFFIEALVLTTFTVAIGYLLSLITLIFLGASSPILATIVYYPFWLAVLVLIGLYGICSLCGIIPVSLLLRKTPSEILSKYDI